MLLTPRWQESPGQGTEVFAYLRITIIGEIRKSSSTRTGPLGSGVSGQGLESTALQSLTVSISQNDIECHRHSNFNTVLGNVLRMRMRLQLRRVPARCRLHPRATMHIQCNGYGGRYTFPFWHVTWQLSWFGPVRGRKTRAWLRHHFIAQHSIRARLGWRPLNTRSNYSRESRPAATNECTLTSQSCHQGPLAHGRRSGGRAWSRRQKYFIFVFTRARAGSPFPSSCWSLSAERHWSLVRRRSHRPVTSSSTEKSYMYLASLASQHQPRVHV